MQTFGSAVGLDHVLFVDDDMQVQKAFRRLMHRSAIPSVCVATSREAMAELERDPMRFGAVVSDLVLAHESGLDVLQAAAERVPWASRILVSGQLDLETALEAVKRCRVSRMLTKPWSLEELRDAVRDGIDRAFLGIRSTRALAERQSPSPEDTHSMRVGELARLRPLLETLADWADRTEPEGPRRHARRLARYALELGRSLGMENESQEELELGVLLHDVGKLAAPEDGPADATTSLPLEHPSAGHLLLSGLSVLQPVAQIVVEHHERYDGLGSPRGLAGDEICLGARIFRVVSVFDKVTGWPRDSEAVAKGLSRLADEAGAQLDPVLVESFRRLPVPHLVELS